MTAVLVVWIPSAYQSAVMLLVFFLLYTAFHIRFSSKFTQEVADDHIGFDGVQIYRPGDHWIPYRDFTTIDITPRITTFGVDILGLVSVIETERREDFGHEKRIRSLVDSTENLSGYRNTAESVTTREKEKYRQKYVIVWKPRENPASIRQFLKTDVPAKFSEILRTLPDTNIRQFAGYLGVEILELHGFGKQESGNVVKLGDGIELPDSDRAKHIYILGKPGSGKSTLILNAAKQDIESGKGVAIIDPHGDLIKNLLPHIPANRIQDTIYFDATSLPLGIDFFATNNAHEKELVADDIYVLFRRLTESWGERMDAIVRYTVRALLAAPKTTFLDIHRFLTDETFRRQVLSNAGDRALSDFWTKTYPTYPRGSEQPIVSRMAKFVSNPTLRTIVGSVSPLRFTDVLQKRQILLIRIAAGEIGQDTSAIIGSLVVSQFQLAATRRANLPEKDRIPFYLYIDEFQNFKTSAFQIILSESRKYQLCLALAHQYLYQLDQDTKSAVLNTIGTSIFFRLGKEDAKHMATHLGRETSELQSLPVGEAVIQPAEGETTRFCADLPSSPKTDFTAAIIKHTQTTYPSAQADADATIPPPRIHDAVRPGRPPR